MAKAVDVRNYKMGYEALKQATQERIRKGNVLYNEYVRISEIGKSLFVDNDEAKYNNYVINDAPPVMTVVPPTTTCY